MGEGGSNFRISRIPTLRSTSEAKLEPKSSLALSIQNTLCATPRNSSACPVHDGALLVFVIRIVAIHGYEMQYVHDCKILSMRIHSYICISFSCGRSGRRGGLLRLPPPRRPSRRPYSACSSPPPRCTVATDVFNSYRKQ